MEITIRRRMIIAIIGDIAFLPVFWGMFIFGLVIN